MNAVDIECPAEQTDRDMEDGILASYLRTKRDEADAKCQAESMEGIVLAILRRRGVGIDFPLLGSLSVVESTVGASPDMDAIQAFYQAHGQPVPMKPNRGGGPQLKASLVK